jgi:hypothetical protein
MRTRRGGTTARVPRAGVVVRRRFAAVAIVSWLLHRKSRVVVGSGYAAPRWGDSGQAQADLQRLLNFNERSTRFQHALKTRRRAGVLQGDK